MNIYIYLQDSNNRNLNKIIADGLSVISNSDIFRFSKSEELNINGYYSTIGEWR